MAKRVVLAVAALGIAIIGGLYLLTAPAGPDPQTGLHIEGMLHVNVNCSDFERSRKFYEMLGFTVLMRVEETADAELAAVVGMDSYVVKGALMAHKDGAVIDLLQWRSPRDERPPYGNLNHLGLARIAFATTDITADIARLKAAGVVFLTEKPAEVADPLGGTTRFICFKDPDGTVLELVEMGAVLGAVQRASALATKSGS